MRTTDNGKPEPGVEDRLLMHRANGRIMRAARRLAAPDSSIVPLVSFAFGNIVLGVLLGVFVAVYLLG